VAGQHLGNSIDSRSCLPYSGGFNTGFNETIYSVKRREEDHSG